MTTPKASDAVGSDGLQIDDDLQIDFVVERLVDVTAVRLTNPEFHKGFEVFLLPNLYSDIITDNAVEYQGRLGTGGLRQHWHGLSHL